MPSTVLILGNAEDDHAYHVALEVAKRGLNVAWLDSREFPAALRVAFEPGGHGYLVTGEDEQNIPFEDVRSVYWRTYFGASFVDLPNAEQAELASNDARSLFESLLIDLPARWVNGWAGFQLHQCKPAALSRVKRLDLGPNIRVPETLQSNDSDAVRQFVERVGSCIFKPVQGGAHTQRLTAENLTDENLSALRLAPVTIQQEVQGTDIRVFIAGERVMACELLTDKLDFRDDEDPRIEPVELPEGMAEFCLKICQACDLVWTGMDFRRTDDGIYYYFESNPSPMFLGFESRCGLPLSEALVDLLTVC